MGVVLFCEGIWFLGEQNQVLCFSHYIITKWVVCRPQKVKWNSPSPYIYKCEIQTFPYLTPFSLQSNNKTHVCPNRRVQSIARNWLLLQVTQHSKQRTAPGCAYDSSTGLCCGIIMANHSSSTELFHWEMHLMSEMPFCYYYIAKHCKSKCLLCCKWISKYTTWSFDNFWTQSDSVGMKTIHTEWEYPVLNPAQPTRPCSSHLAKLHCPAPPPPLPAQMPGLKLYRGSVLSMFRLIPPPWTVA